MEKRRYMSLNDDIFRLLEKVLKLHPKDCINEFLDFHEISILVCYTRKVHIAISQNFPNFCK